MIRDIYLAGCVRTPLGSFCGAFSDVTAVDLGITAVRAALERSGLKPEDIDETMIGNILSGGLRPNAARQVSIGAGLGIQVPATTINVLCGSGMKAIMLAAQAIQCGDAEAIVAGGIESMTRAPYLLEKARTGYRMGHGEVFDSMLRDALIDPFDGKHMGECGDTAAVKYGFTREQQDDFAIASYKRALAAAAAGVFKNEIAPVTIKGRKGDVIIDSDEEPHRFNEEKFRKLRAAFGEDGTVTAGNASSINDGAAAMVVLSGEKAKSSGAKVLAKLLGYSAHAHEPEWFTLAPIKAIEKLMNKLKWKVEDVDLFEINEAFSVVPMAAMHDLGIPHEKTNVHGGAVCMGHPVGASGARIVATLVNALKVKGGQTGIASLCIGGGQAVAVAVELC